MDDWEHFAAVRKVVEELRRRGHRRFFLLEEEKDDRADATAVKSHDGAGLRHRQRLPGRRQLHGWGGQ